MNKKQLANLVQVIVLSTAASLNQNATDADSEPEITEDEARALFGIHFRKASKQLIADAAGCELEDVKFVKLPEKAPKAKTPAKETKTS